MLESNRASEINTPVVELHLLTESDSQTIELNRNAVDSLVQKLKDALEQSKQSHMSKKPIK